MSKQVEMDDQSRLLEDLRARLREQDNNNLEEYKLSNDKFLLRYLRFNSNKVDKAEEMLRFYLTFNKEHNTEGLLVKEDFPPDFKKDFKCYFGGWDHDQRPVMMIPDTKTWNVKKYVESGMSEMVAKYFLKMHLMQEKLTLERNSDYGVAIIDAGNLQYSQYFHKRSLGILLETFRVTTKRSPGVTGLVIIINAPRALKLIFDTFKKLVTLTMDVVMFSKNEDWREKIKQYFPENGICPEFGGTLTTHVEI